jgi:hypothetical protein
MNLRKKIVPLGAVALVTVFLLINQQCQWFPTQVVSG